MSLKRNHQILLLIATVLAVYYPANFAEISAVEDQGTIHTLQSIQTLSLKGVFNPGLKNGIYYRPLLEFTLLVDKFLWKLVPSIMHFENIIIHVINSLLIYWFTLQLIPKDKKERSFLPLSAAMLFGLHPVNTEPVNWISARADVLACTFVLLSTNFLVKFHKTHYFRYLSLVVFFMILGFLTKEVSLAFLAGVFLMLSAENQYDNSDNMDAPARKDQRTGSNNFIVLLLAGGALAGFFSLRSSAFTSNASRIGGTIRFLFSDITHSFLVFLRTLAFYLKKLVFPWPLNFTIVEIDPLYEILAVPLVLLGFYLISRKTMLSATFMTGALLIFPSFLIALQGIAWTPYAERYLYLPAAFIMIAFILYGAMLMEKVAFRLPWKGVMITTILAVFAVTSFQRSVLWMHNETLFEDTVRKNPTFYPVRREYAAALARRGDLHNARIQLELSNTHHDLMVPRAIHSVLDGKYGYWEDADLGLAELLVQEGKIAEAMAAYERIYTKSKGRSVRALNSLVSLYADMLFQTEEPSAAALNKKKLLFYAGRLYNTSPNSATFYRIAKLFLKQGDRIRALVFFHKAYDSFEEGNVYKIFAAKFISILETK